MTFERSSGTVIITVQGGDRWQYVYGGDTDAKRAMARSGHRGANVPGVMWNAGKDGAPDFLRVGFSGGGTTKLDDRNVVLEEFQDLFDGGGNLTGAEVTLSWGATSETFRFELAHVDIADDLAQLVQAGSESGDKLRIQRTAGSASTVMDFELGDGTKL